MNSDELVRAIQNEFPVMDTETANAIRKHNFKDPFAYSYGNLERTSYSSFSTVVTCRGNLISNSGRRFWIIDGKLVKIDTGMNNRFTPNVAAKVRAPLLESIANDFRSLGYKVRTQLASSHQAHASMQNKKLRKDELEMTMPSDGDHAYYVITSARKLPDGTIGNMTQRFDSLGLVDTAQRIHEGWQDMDASAPASIEETERRRLEMAEREIHRLFDGHGADAPEIKIGKDFGSEAVLFEGLDAQLKPMTIPLRLSMSQPRPGAYHALAGTSGWKDRISTQVSRRNSLEKYGKPSCTSLAFEIMKHAGLPMVEHDGASPPKKGSIPIGGGTSYRLMTKNGRIEGEVVYKNMKVTTGQFRLSDAALPDTIMDALTGRPLRELMEHPLINDDIRIVSVKTENGDIVGRCRGKTTAFPEEATLDS